MISLLPHHSSFVEIRNGSTFLMQAYQHFPRIEAVECVFLSAYGELRQGHYYAV